MSDRFAPPPSVFGLSRNVVIASGVIVFHAAALWALQSGLLRRAAEVVIPVEIMSQFVEPPKPKVEPPPPPPPPPKVAKAPPPPRPQAIREPKPTPAPQAPVGTTEPPPPPAPPAAPTPPAPPALPPAPPAPPAVQLPSSNADYLQNPKAVYPAMSKRLGEQGKVIVKVLVGVDGLPKSAEVKKSSGFDRLDEAAIEYIMKCRFVPGKVNGVVQAMSYDAPVNYVLN
ncbi:protein TonB [Variovorax boronicumulans]|uniref:Protein TonB n=1 Tax=Variovorax boronicumulans TaxID=436515 RepID=A0AAW8CY55_9BURK|nr:protein TonB [Variovorax boronicumulans]MDQ0055444.1 protein TonB [Variovorax boronicumulans]MDQ0068930.1 protein TonB [Variovorax boronicumulans]